VTEFSFLAGLSVSDKINLFSSLGAWISGLGALSAVVLALYLANRDRTIRVRLSEIGRASCRERRVTITGVGWRIGFLQRKFLQQVMYPSPSPMPATLVDGDQAAWHIPFLAQGDEPNWIEEFSKVLGKNPRLMAKSLRVFVYTSVGKIIMAKVEMPLRETLISAAKNAESRRADVPDSSQRGKR